jgi:hypothetical protein
VPRGNLGSYRRSRFFLDKVVASVGRRKIGEFCHRFVLRALLDDSCITSRVFTVVPGGLDNVVRLVVLARGLQVEMLRSLRQRNGLWRSGGLRVWETNEGGKSVMEGTCAVARCCSAEKWGDTTQTKHINLLRPVCCQLLH